MQLPQARIKNSPDKAVLMFDVLSFASALLIAVVIFTVLVWGSLWLVERHCRDRQIVCSAAYTSQQKNPPGPERGSLITLKLPLPSEGFSVGV